MSTIDAFEVYNDFDRNLVNLFRCMKERTMATIRELGFCHLNSREDFIALRKFFEQEQFDDRYLSEELALTEILLPPPEAAELKEIRLRIAEAGIDVDESLQFTAADGRVTMENVPPDEAEIVCDGDCERCPLHLLAGIGKYGDGL